MHTEGINNNHHNTTRQRISRTRTRTEVKKEAAPAPAGKKPPLKADTFQSTFLDEREQLLEIIKKKVEAGYYNSKEVTDDLSDTFANIFRDTL